MLFKLLNLNSNLALTLGFLNPALNNSAQVSMRQAWHVCSQHSFGLPLRINGMHRKQSEHAPFTLYLL